MILNPVIAGGGVETVKGTLTNMNTLSESPWLVYYLPKGNTSEVIGVKLGETVEIEVQKGSIIELGMWGGSYPAVSGGLERLYGYSSGWKVIGDFMAKINTPGGSN